ncbi:MAG: hypothetical protein H6694_02235 [Candidatus Latescibacteria bacterium]|nr:hypothetical protein [Candidatus Latescibacterota bacterium]
MRLALCLVLAIAALQITPVAAPAEDVILVEGETYVASHDLGGYSIHVTYCSSASGGYAADGLDIPGEWIELDVTLAEAHAYRARLALQGWPDESSTLRLTLTPQAGGDAPERGLRARGLGNRLRGALHLGRGRRPAAGRRRRLPRAHHVARRLADPRRSAGVELGR